MDEVAEKVKETESNTVKNEIYGSYHPKIYDRRMDNGGLSDVSNMDSKLESSGVMSVTNNTMTHPTITMGGKTYDSKNKGNLLTSMVVEGGNDNYDFPADPYSEPRDFIGATKSELERSGMHVEALKQGLRKRNISIK